MRCDIFTGNTDLLSALFSSPSCWPSSQIHLEQGRLIRHRAVCFSAQISPSWKMSGLLKRRLSQYQESIDLFWTKCTASNYSRLFHQTHGDSYQLDPCFSVSLLIKLVLLMTYSADFLAWSQPVCRPILAECVWGCWPLVLRTLSELKPNGWYHQHRATHLGFLSDSAF